MSMQISFPGGVAVTATFDDFAVLTDQPVGQGGQSQAPSPFSLFLAALGTCAGFFALRFCQERDLPTAGLAMTLDAIRDPATKHLERVTLKLTLPEGFPEKYQRAILRATDQCAVKRALLDPPEILVELA